MEGTFDEVRGLVANAQSSCEAGEHSAAAKHYQDAIELLGIVCSTMDSDSPDKPRLMEVSIALKKELRVVQSMIKVDNEIKISLDSRGTDSPPNDPSIWSPPPTQPMNRRASSQSRTSTVPRSTHAPKSRTASGSTAPESSTNRRMPQLPAAARGKPPSSNANAAGGTPEDEQVAKEGTESTFFNSRFDGHLVSQVETLMRRESGVTWDTIVGHQETKTLFNQTVILPVLMPSFFTGIRRPWSGVLLYGPPGTGKTMMAKAVAAECKSTFFAVNCSDITSKWRGDSEQIVAILFAMARHYAPSTIFIDELDTIASSRGGNNEHEASNRVKSVLLTEMDGFSSSSEWSGGAGKGVLVLGATNFPWLIDTAILRRFEQRIQVPVPDVAARLDMLKKFLGEVKLTPEAEQFLPTLAVRLNNYSGADIGILCRKAALYGVNELLKTMTVIQVSELPHDQVDLPVKKEDLEKAMESVHPVHTNEMQEKYDNFGSQH